MSDRSTIPATGRYEIGRKGITIFGGYDVWPIYGPDGAHICNVMGIAYLDPTKNDPGDVQSKAGAQRLVDSLNQLMIGQKAS